MQSPEDSGCQSVINVVGPMPNHPWSRGIVWIKRPVIKSVNLSVKLDIEHSHPRQRIFTNILFNDAPDRIPLANIVKARRLID